MSKENQQDAANDVRSSRALASAKSESSAPSRVRYFQLLVNDPFTGERPGWYWQDDDCEEPMGPFASRREAGDDYRDCRPSSPDGSAKR